MVKYTSLRSLLLVTKNLLTRTRIFSLLTPIYYVLHHLTPGYATNPLTNPTACQTSYVLCYTCVFDWLNGVNGGAAIDEGDEKDSDGRGGSTNESAV